MKCTVWRRVLLIAVPCIVGVAWPFVYTARYVTQDEALKEARELLGVTREGCSVFVVPPASFSKIREARVDLSGNGKCDLDVIYVREQRDKTCLYSDISDDDEDGQADLVSFRVGTEEGGTFLVTVRNRAGGGSAPVMLLNDMPR